MTKTEQTIIKYIDTYNLIKKGDKILTALSGGPDSVFLLTFLHKFRKKYKIEIGAFHLNHMLRGKHADKDEKFCRDMCLQLKIPFFSHRTDIKKKAAAEKISIEEAGRNERYALLQEIASGNGYTLIATGHNLDDNTETVLLNLIKGTGIKGISGIPLKRDNIIRPLLSISKKEIILFLNENNIRYITDKSNFSDDYERNFIRNRILPLVRKNLNPSVDKAVLRSAEIFRRIADSVEKKSADITDKMMEKSINKIEIAQLQQFEKEIQSEVIKKVLERNFVKDGSFNDTMLVLSLIDKKPGAKIVLSGKIKAVRERGYLEFISKENPADKEYKIKTGETCTIDGMELGIVEWRGDAAFSDDKKIEYIDAEKSGDRFIVRPWKAGDRFTPLGMKGTVKVSDFLNSQKIPVSFKNRQMVLTDKQDIIWVIGYRINEKFKIKPETRRKLKLWVK